MGENFKGANKKGIVAKTKPENQIGPDPTLPRKGLTTGLEVCVVKMERGSAVSGKGDCFYFGNWDL